ncbi:hypothetical protein XENOCAPTIV_016855, partial [Xenoophorus captivus]
PPTHRVKGFINECQTFEKPLLVSQSAYRFWDSAFLSLPINMLTPHLLSLALLLSLGQSSALECTAKHKPGVRYISVRWYKLESYPSLQRSGLLTRSLPNGTTRWYKDATREVHLQGESRDIFLPNMTCSDSGVYLCYLAAPVGEQNQEGKVLLTLTGKRLPQGPVGFTPDQGSSEISVVLFQMFHSIPANI